VANTLMIVIADGALSVDDAAPKLAHYPTKTVERYDKSAD